MVHRDLKFRKNRAVTHREFSCLLGMQQDWKAADEHYRLALAGYEELEKDFPAEFVVLNGAARTRYEHASGLVERKLYAAAEEDLLGAVRAYQRLVAKVEPARKMVTLGELTSATNSLGTLLWKTKRYPRANRVLAKALEAAEDLISQFPSVPENHVLRAAVANNLGGLLLDMKQPEQALQMFRQAVRHREVAVEMAGERPGGAAAVRGNQDGLAKALLALGRHADAAQVAAKLSEILPEDWASYHKAAHVLSDCADLARDDPALADEERSGVAEKYAADTVSMLRGAIERLEDDAATCWELATCTVAGKHLMPREFLALAEKAAQLAPERAAAWGRLADLYKSAGRKKDAIKALEIALGLDPKAAHGWQTLAFLRSETRDLKGAIAAMEESNDLESHAKRMFFLALQYSELGDLQNGRVWYDQARQKIKAEEHMCDDCRAYIRKVASLLGVDPPPEVRTRNRRR